MTDAVHVPDPDAPPTPAGVGDGPVVVVTAMSLTPAARSTLAERLGPGHIVVDIRDAGNTADIVLVPPASPQLLGALRGMFPDARLLIAEFTDAEYGAEFRGPVARSIDSGADGYFVAPTLDELAAATHQAAASPKVAGAVTGPIDAPTALPRGLSGPRLEIDLGLWATSTGVEIGRLRQLAGPLLSQLRQQGFDVRLTGPDGPSMTRRGRNPWQHRRR